MASNNIRSNLLLFGLSLSVAMVSLSDRMVSVETPFLGEALYIDAALLGWINISALLVMTCSIMIFGRLGDLKGRKKLSYIGIITFLIGSILCAISPNGLVLIIFRCVQGLGSSILISNLYAIPKDIFPPEKHGRAIGFITFAVYLGLASAPFLGGFIVDFLNWRWIFLVVLPLGIVALFIIHKTYKLEPVKQPKEKFDLLGAGTFAITLFSLYLSLTLGNKVGWNNILVISLIFIFIISFIIFIMIEKKSDSPMIKLSIFKNANFSTSNFAALLFYITTMSITFLIPIYLKAGFGYTGLEIAMVIFLMPLFMSIFSPISGYLSDKFDNKKICIIGLVILAISFLFLGTMQFQPPISYIILIFAGIGQGIFTSPNVALVIDSVDQTDRGIASSMTTMMRTIGQSSSFAISTALLGLIMPFTLLNSFLSNTITPTPDQLQLFVSSMQFVFYIMFFICIASLILVSIKFFIKKSNK
ncbi:MAG: MFS transporter [Promethearchaeota archaeon]|nr:MAG: MFS transporter [Candidatus Lokiarchaeota archaeon]